MSGGRIYASVYHDTPSFTGQPAQRAVGLEGVAGTDRWRPVRMAVILRPC
jgi:hypothetical protein